MLRKMTGRGPLYWVRQVQTEIGRASVKTEDPNHDHTFADRWLTVLAQRVVKIPPGRRDENMFASAVMVLVLLTWVARVWRAKIMDPRRPIKLRKKSHKRLLEFRAAVLAALTDESLDPKHFPGQEWDDPYSPNAKDGDFV